ncbi:hypothetical protein [Streptomyces noursei]|uniref:hypothetical protein n=1 Tax=Streptomyces noursei TaxID=1971 RepID=UPI0023B7A563|nr:hypothetical protein [Streptomyces noursei]
MDRGDPGPGSFQLGQLIDAGHGAAIRWDLQRLGLDLADVWRGTLAPCRVLDLVEHSPDDSALAAALRGGPAHRPWTLERHLQAALVDAVNTCAWILAQSNGSRSVKRPDPVPRPSPAEGARAGRALDLSRHPLARPLPEQYRTVKG